MTAPASRVREVRVRLRIPAEDAARAAELRHAVEDRMLRQVLDAFETAVADRLGRAAIVRIRRLPIRWRLAATELDDLQIHRRLGEELADAVIAEAGVVLDTVPPRPRPGAGFAAFTDEAHALAVAVVERVEGLPAAFYHPASTLDSLYVAIGAGGRELATAVLARVEVIAADALTAERVRREVAAVIGAAAAGARFVWNADRPVEAPGPSRDEATRAADGSATASTTSSSARVHAARPSDDPGIRGASPSDPPGPPESAGVVTTIGGAACDLDAGDPVVEALDDAMTTHPTVALALERRADRLPTAIGGVAGLVRLMLELELAEHLWCAGIEEGAAIARGLGRVAPPDHREDPLVGVVAGRFDGTPPPPLGAPAWAIAEVADKARDQLGRWLARRGDVRDPDRLGRDLAILEDAVGDRGSLETAIAAIAIAAACSSLGVDWDPAPVHAIVLREGVIAIGDDAIDIEIPLAAVDVDVRRAGLDRDPGWIPWLGRKLRIIYVPGDGDML